LTERILQPETFQVNLQLCKTDFRSDWDAIQMGYSAFDVLPKSFADFLIAHAAEKVAQQMELVIWDGNNASAGEFSGIMRQLDVDASLPAGQKIAGTSITAANVIAELGSMIDALPALNKLRILDGCPMSKLEVAEKEKRVALISKLKKMQEIHFWLKIDFNNEIHSIR
jgi:hypothetical protein